MLLVIDNFDSFTFNLVQYLGILGVNTKVIRNNAMSLAEIEVLKPEKILLSPGPGAPHEAGICLAVIEHFSKKTPILGVCLGHQCLAEAFGGKIIRAKKVVHGKTSPIFHSDKGVFNQLKQGFSATRYHSLIIDKKTLPQQFEITAWTGSQNKIDEIMGIKHKSLPLEGVQFHPESILTEQGLQLLKNFITKV